jgi:hypothetical protein
MPKVTSLDELKNVIANMTHGKQAASSACDEIDVYARLWPYVFMINDWDVWTNSKTILRLQVVRWLEQHGGVYDFYRLHDRWGLVGFHNLKAATHFKLRWSGESRMMVAPAQGWNPHPRKSTFEPDHLSDDAGSRRPGERYARFDRARDHATKPFQGHRTSPGRPSSSPQDT